MIYKLITILFIFCFPILGQTDWQNRFMLAERFEQTGEVVKAKELLEPLMLQMPDNYQIFEALNRVYVTLKEYQKSIQLVSERLKRNTQDLNSYGLLGKTYYIMGEESKAFEIWKDGIKYNSNNPNSYRIMANFAIERRAFDKGIEFLREGKKISEDKSTFSYELANLYALTMRFEEAAKEYCEIVAADPAHVRLAEARIFAYVNKPGALQATIKVFENCGKNNLPVMVILSRLYYDNKDFDKALIMHTKIDEIQGNEGTELYNFAHLVYTEGDYKAASKVYSIILSKYPNSRLSSGAKLGFAKSGDASLRKEAGKYLPLWKPYYAPTLKPSSRTEEVLRTYEDLASSYPHTEVAHESFFRMGKLKLELYNDFDGAEKDFLRITTKSPLSEFAPAAIREMGRIALLKGDKDKAEKFFEELKNNPRGSEEDKNYANVKLAKINFYQGEFGPGREYLGKVVTNLRDNNANDAIELLMLMNTTMYDSSKLMIFAEGDFLAEQQKYQDAIEKFRLIAEDEKLFALANLAELRRAEMELALNRYSEAASLLDSLVENEKRNIYADKALYLQAKIYQNGINDPESALKLYEKLLAKFPGSLYQDEVREQIIELRKKIS
jgi:tetratricopeptide (TPR) repeat protein